MRNELVSEDVGVGKNGAKTRATQEYLPTHPRAKLWNRCLWVEGSCWGKRIKLELVNKASVCKKKSSCMFSQSLARKCLSWMHVSLCPIAPPRGGKTKHHWGSRRNKCQVVTLYKSCVSLSNGKWNATCTSCRRAMGMRLYNQGWQRPKWKEPRTSNVETHV